MKKTILYDLIDIDALAKLFLQEVSGVSIITCCGALGAGKTTFVSALLKELGVVSAVTSPTFTYMNTYKLPDGRMVYHFDLYRLKNVFEFESAGFFEYLDHPNSLVIIEWPEIILPLLQQGVCHVILEIEGQTTRKITYGVEK